MSKKNITIISSLIAFIVIVASGYFFYKNSGQNNIKADHDKYLALINDNHNFDEGVKGLENLDNDKGQKIFKNIKIEIKIAKELKNTNTSLDNKDIDSAKKSLEKVETLTIDNSFDKAIDWLKEDITNYDKVLKEINDAKPDDINTIIDKYKFNHTSLKQKLNDEANKKVSKKTIPNMKCVLSKFSVSTANPKASRDIYIPRYLVEYIFNPLFVFSYFVSEKYTSFW